MKRIATVVSVMVASALFSATAILAADKFTEPFGQYGYLKSVRIKNECLLIAKNCVTDTSTVQQRVIDLRAEIIKGLDVYTPTELKVLKEQLKWIESESSDQID